ncbi:MAG TPA: outer membrane beta-barrel protein [Dongiaceae bacterium]|nr:outer membrane beta-barrel protein [Dongiaceae bacterium]
MENASLPVRSIFLSSLLSFLLVPTAQAFDASQRAETWEGYIRFDYLLGQNIDAYGTKAETEDALGFGFGVGYNLDGHWAFDGRLHWANIDYDAQVEPAAGNILGPYTAEAELAATTLNFNATYYAVDEILTPFISAGIGFTYIDTTIPGGPAVPVCWYDPWWGYYCGAAVPTQDETELSYNLALGLRWDISRYYFARLQATNQWVDVEGDADTPYITAVGFDLGIRF